MRKFGDILGVLLLVFAQSWPIAAPADSSAGDPICTVLSAGSDCGDGQICDGIRKICVAACTGTECCDSVTCPPGAKCIPGRGTCGTPAGEACFDLGTSWSTASAAPGAESAADTPRRVDIVVLNRTGAALFFPASTAMPRPRFDIVAIRADEERTLGIPANQFCPTWCPERGPIPEIDCAAPDPGVVRLPDGAGLRLAWSGNEAVTNVRLCAAQGTRTCLSEIGTQAGRYAVEVCAFGDVTTPAAEERAGLLRGAEVSGPEDCMRVPFVYPEESEVTLTFEE